MKLKTGFSLLEIVAVLVLLSFLVGVSLTLVGDSQDREERQKVNRDLLLIDSAKSSWRTDHPIQPFTGFADLQPYLKIGLQLVPSLEALAGPNSGLTYTIGTESIPSGASKAGKTFNRDTQQWQ